MSGWAADVEHRAVAGKFLGQIGSKIGHCLLGDFLEVVEGVAGFVGWRGTSLAQLVGLPDEINDFGERSVLASPSGTAGRRWNGQHGGDAAQLRQHGPPTRLGRVSGEHRPHGERIDCGLQTLRADRLGHGGHRLRQPTLVGGPPPQTPDPMDLLRDVGEQEVRRKRADQIGCCVDRLPGQQGPNIASSPVPINLERGLLALLGQRSHAFHEVEQLRAFLAHQRFAEQSHDAAHVGSEGGVRVRGNRR